MSAEVLRSRCAGGAAGRRRWPRERPGAHPGSRRRRDDVPGGGSATDLALLLVDHHGASLIVTAGHTRQHRGVLRPLAAARATPSTFLTRLKVGEKLVDAKAVATLYRSRMSGGAIALLVLAMLIAVIVALWVSRADATVLHWVTDYWNRFLLWVQTWSARPDAPTDWSIRVISLRSHAISLAAVFLALAVGVVLGSGLLSNTLLSGLRDDKHELQNQINELTDDKNLLNEQLSAAGEFDGQMTPRIVHDALAGKAVVIFRTPDAVNDDVEAVSKTIAAAGGAVSGTITLTERVRRCQRRGKIVVGGQFAGPAGRPAVEHQGGGPRFAGRRSARASRCCGAGTRPFRPSMTPSARRSWPRCATPDSSRWAINTSVWPTVR